MIPCTPLCEFTDCTYKRSTSNKRRRGAQNAETPTAEHRVFDQRWGRHTTACHHQRSSKSQHQKSIRFFCQRFWCGRRSTATTTTAGCFTLRSHFCFPIHSDNTRARTASTEKQKPNQSAQTEASGRNETSNSNQRSKTEPIQTRSDVGVKKKKKKPERNELFMNTSYHDGTTCETNERANN